MRYEWDERKNILNQRKHGVSFQTASLVFEDESCVIYLDRSTATVEQRFHAIGGVPMELGQPAVLLVVHTYREALDGEEIIRIVSARAASKHELRRYQAQAVD